MKTSLIGGGAVMLTVAMNAHAIAGRNGGALPEKTVHQLKADKIHERNKVHVIEGAVNK